MKKILISCIILLLVTNVFSQKNFEGMIRYKATSTQMEFEDGDKTDAGEIKMFFSLGKVLISTNKNTEENEEEIIIVLLDSAKVYTLNKNEKTYRVKKLVKHKLAEPAGIEMIAGHKGIPQQVSSNNWTKTIGGNSTLWFAEDLQFTVPVMYEGNEELLMIHNNHILLKAVIRLDERIYGYNKNEEEEDTVASVEPVMTLVAVEVIPGIQPPSLFTIPVDYTKEIPYEYNVMDSVVAAYPDTMAIAVDSAAVAVPDYKMPAPQKKTPAKAPVKKATTSKPPAKKDD